MEKRPDQIKILLIDDDIEDIELTMEIMKMSKIKLDIMVARDGLEALELLQSALADPEQLMPDLIMLDLNMPRMDGHEFLQKIKSHDRLKRIPTVILTTSKSEKDIAASYDYGVSCYITKPVGLDQFQEVVDSINNFWFTIVKYPSK